MLETASRCRVYGKRRPNATYTSIDFGFLELYGLKPLAGRFHDVNRGADTFAMDVPTGAHEPVVLNEAAVRALGYRSPEVAVPARFVSLFDPPCST
jgi:hypothetical protein